jgi:glycosyltransferase involved in cell wall biosynthesis
MSLRILHVTPYFSEAWAYGGIPRVATAQARGLSRLGHQVTVVTTDACDADRRLPLGWRDPHVDVRVFPNVSNRLAFHWQCYLPRGARKFLHDVVSTFDIVHIHAHRNALQVMTADACRKANVPYVLGPNGTAPRLERRLALKRVWDAMWGRTIIRDAAAVVAVSPAERRQLQSLGIADRQLHELPNPVELSDFAEPLDAVSRTAASPVVAFLGKVTPRKRLDVVVEAMPHVTRKDARLAIAGSDMGGLADSLRLADARGLGARVDRAGTLAGRARLAWLAAADVVVYPSTDEAFGLVPVEALLCGTPVIVADDSGCAEVVGSLDGAQVVRAGDPRALATAIDAVLDDPRAWRAAAALGGAAARERFGADAVVNRLDALYRKVLAH